MDGMDVGVAGVDDGGPVGNGIDLASELVDQGQIE